MIGVAPFDYTLYSGGGAREWEAWLNSFEWFLLANKIEDDHDKFVKLMHLAGQKIQELYATLPVPDHISKVRRGPLIGGFVPHLTEYQMAIEKLNDHFQPKKNATYERYELRKLTQEPDEKIALFAMRLRKQAERCDLGDKLEEHVKDQLIGKCASSRLRRKLLALGDATLDVVLREAKAFEAVQEQSKILDEKNETEADPDKRSEVNKIDVRRKPSQLGDNKSMECFRCGFTGHRQFDEKCPAKGKKCNKCGGLNHFSRKCRSIRKRPRQVIETTTQLKNEPDPNTSIKFEDEPTPSKKVKVDGKEAVVKYISPTTNDSEPTIEYIFHIGCSGRDAKNEFKLQIGGITVVVVIDSGSKYNIIDSRAWEYLKAKGVQVRNQRTTTNINFSAYGNHMLTFVGVFEATIATAKTKSDADFYVFKDYGKILIGYDTAFELNILKIGECVNNVVTTGETGKIKGIVVNIPIDPSVRPVAQPYRRIPVALEESVDTKIQELLSAGIIEKVDGPSEWISPVVVVPKSDNDLRICIDMRRANEAVLRENHPLPCFEDFLPHLGQAKWFTKLDIKNAFHQVTKEIHD